MNKTTVEAGVVLVMGAFLYALIGWHSNIALAGLAAPIFLLRYSRSIRSWKGYLPLGALLIAGSALAMWGGWDLDPWLFPLFGLVKMAPVMITLVFDRYLGRRIASTSGGLLSGLVAPAAMTALDWILSLTPLSTVLSPAVGLYGLGELSQAASLGGVWLLGFIVWWFAAGVNAAWEHSWNLRASGPGWIAPACALAVAVAYGAVRLSLNDLSEPTVRVAGVTVPHERDYWNIIDRGTPREEAVALRDEAMRLQDRLFEGSARAAGAGARVVVWSEGACLLDEQTEAAFVERAGAFAKERGIYLAASVLTLRFGSGLSDNKVLMFGPDGGLAFTYVKTISWYPTGSTGELYAIDSPYGRLGVAICYDMDTPSFARRLAKLGADIVLVPAYDTSRISPFHTEVGLFRAIENGYAIFRQVADGTSMAVDGAGALRALQDYGATRDRVMFADLPMKARKPIARALGDTVAYLSIASVALLAILGVRRRTRAESSGSE